MRRRELDVLVQGAGPVGMFAALCLSERGLRVRVVDKYARTALHSYALALHPQSLRLFDSLGLGATLDAHGYPIEQIRLHHAAGSATIDLSAIGGDFSHVLAVPQRVLEGVLEARLADNGVDVEWNRQVLMFDDGPEGISALVARNADEWPEDPGQAAKEPTERIEATFLFGADGCDSLTRKLLGIEQTDAGPAVRLGLVEFEKRLDSPRRMEIVLGDETTDALWPLARECGRWSVQLDEVAAEDDTEHVKRLIAARAPWFGSDFGRVNWATSVRFEQFMAQRFGRGPVWLIGDAARFTSPIGVQSMNVGFRESHDLARRVAAVLRERKSPRLLDYYNEERQREWKMMLGIKDRLRLDGEAPEWARNAASRLVRSIPASGHDLNLLLQQIGLRLYWLRGRDDG